MSTNGHWACPECRRKKWRSAAQRRHAESAHVRDQVGATRPDPSVRRCQQDQQDRRIIVEPVQRHPRHPTIFCAGPLSQQGRLAVTRRRSDRDHAAIARATRLDEFAPTHRTSAKLRNRKLGIQQRLLELSNRRRLGLARIHSHDRILGMRGLNTQPNQKPSLDTSPPGEHTLGTSPSPNVDGTLSSVDTRTRSATTHARREPMLNRPRDPVLDLLTHDRGLGAHASRSKPMPFAGKEFRPPPRQNRSGRSQQVIRIRRIVPYPT
jgi:hypothetical protein